MLKEVFQKREEFMSLIKEKFPDAYPAWPVDLTKKESQSICREIALKGVEEMFEALQHLKNWKSHRQTEIPDINHEEFLEEIVDAFNYFFSLMILIGVDVNDFYTSFLRKDKIIRDRLKKGYWKLNRIVDLHGLLFDSILETTDEVWNVILDLILSKGLLFKDFKLTLNLTYLGFYYCVENLTDSNKRISDTSQHFFSSNLLNKSFIDIEIELKFKFTDSEYKIYFDECNYYTLDLEDDYSVDSDDGIIQATIELNTNLEKIDLIKKDFELNMIKPFFLAEFKVFNESLGLIYSERDIKFCVKISQLYYLIQRYKLSLEDAIDYSSRFINLTNKDHTKIEKLIKKNFFNS